MRRPRHRISPAGRPRSQPRHGKPACRPFARAGSGRSRLEAGWQVLVDPAGSVIPGLHWRRGFNIEELKVPSEECRGHVKDVRRHEEVDEHGLEDLVHEVG